MEAKGFVLLGMNIFITAVCLEIQLWIAVVYTSMGVVYTFVGLV